MTHKVQLSSDGVRPIAVLAGETPEEFLAHAKAVLGDDGAKQACEFFVFAFKDALGKALMQQAERNAIDAGFQPVESFPTRAAPSAPSAAGANAAPPAPSSNTKQETDKFGRTYTYEVPGAPTCPHGTTVLLEATSKAGKPYKRWECGTKSPAAYRAKVQKVDSCEGGGFAK